VEDNLEGDDSRVIMDRAEPFIRQCASDATPFLAVIWFHTPHEPVVAGPQDLELYSRYPDNHAHYYGCVTAMDRQVGRLTRLLGELELEEDTMVWFCSDNGPEGRVPGDLNHPRLARSCGVTGGLRGRKRSLFSGGITVPALLRWPRMTKPGQVIQGTCSTLDYLPTVLDAMGSSLPHSRPVDGISLLPALRNEWLERPKPVPYRFLESRESMFGSPTFAVIDGPFKYLTNLTQDAGQDLCFDLENDPYEQSNIISKERRRCRALRGFLQDFHDSCRRSHEGADYSEPYEPVAPFQEAADWVS
jgi:arylsulfatase A-like enzyme